jgi:hypothetical protein
MPGIEIPSPDEQPENTETAPQKPSVAEEVAFTPIDHVDQLDEGDEDAASVQVMPPEVKVTEDNRPETSTAEHSQPSASNITEYQEDPKPTESLADTAIEATLPQSSKEIPPEITHAEKTSAEKDSAKDASREKSKDAEPAAPGPDSEHAAEDPVRVEEAPVETTEDIKEDKDKATQDGDKNEEPTEQDKETAPEAHDEDAAEKEKTKNETKDNPRSTAIQTMGESNRPPEFKAARDNLTADVNEWANDIAKRRDEGTPLSDGTVIRDTSRVTSTDIGPVNSDIRASVEERRSGVSVTGDGVQEPIHVQAVRVNKAGATEVIEIIGSDPLDVALYGDEHSFDRKSTLASFNVRDISASQERSFGFSITGEGEIQRHFIDERGYRITEPLKDEAEINMAAQAFGQITEDLA